MNRGFALSFVAAVNKADVLFDCVVVDRVVVVNNVVVLMDVVAGSKAVPGFQCAVASAALVFPLLTFSSVFHAAILGTRDRPIV